MLCHSPSGAHSIGDLLITVASKDRGKDRPAVITALLSALRAATAVLPDSPPRAAAADSQSPTESPTPSQHSSAALTVSRLLLLLTTLDAPSAEEAATQGAADVCLAALEAWMSGYTAGVHSLGSALTDPNQVERVRIALQVGLMDGCSAWWQPLFPVVSAWCCQFQQMQTWGVVHLDHNHFRQKQRAGLCASVSQ